ncbi:argininosuccinate lyase [Limnochorda pilosa]|uniref:Argininosuccinate lyase n=1 Tax=Limnochorda pilosa TaxID=1555112 RepID=A0A0K2SGE3_LIMPI|nr:argininosuccinate lyase [Limnochorda pilosa]BAS26168.1 argininosuccinate lyase [Limnochorda pilosa]
MSGGRSKSGGSRWDERYVDHVLRPSYELWQQRYWEHFFALQQAHLVALVRAGWLNRSDARAIALALFRVEGSGLRGEPYQGDVEDLFFRVQEQLEAEAGEVAGHLHLARSRNDIDVTLYRMDLRRALLSLHEQVGLLSGALLEQARRHVDTIMPGYTHGQQAQPTTLAHYLAAVLDAVERACRRLEGHYPLVNRSPLGAAAFATSGFTIDRRLQAELLGFDGIVRNSYDAVAATDYLLPFLAECGTLGATLSRFNADLLFWASNEVAALWLPNGLVQASSIMPNKRNPVVLEHIRSRLGRVPALVQQAYALHANVPFGDINDTAENLQPVWHQAVDLLGAAVDLLARVVSELQVDRDLLRRRAGEGFSTVTELADTLVRQRGLSFHHAHAVVARLVEVGREHELPPSTWTPRLLEEVADSTLGRPVSLQEAELQEALDPGHFVDVRRTEGGPAPEQVRAMLDEARAGLEASERWRTDTHARLDAASQQRLQEVQRLVDGANPFDERRGDRSE